MGTKISLKQLGEDVTNLLYYTNSPAVDSPIGEIIAYMGTEAPSNYLICDGTIYNIANYPYLAEHIKKNFDSYNYFGGDGTETFAVPDLCGEFLRGAGKNSYANQGNGADVGEHQDSTIVPAFCIDPGNSMLFAPRPIPNTGLYGDSYGAPYETNNAREGRSWIKADQVDAHTDGSGGSNMTVRPTNTSVLFCIKYQINVGHTYSYEERRVGTWVDGKPLYEKTIDCGSAPNTTTKKIPHGIDNVDTIWVLTAYAISTTGEYFTYPLNISSGSVTNFLTTSVNLENVQIQSGNNASHYRVMIILRYTKTTD